jgi:hypothetical protein
MSRSAILFVACLAAISARAGNGEVPADTRLDTIVVTAKKHMEPVPDAMRIKLASEVY